MAYTKRYLAGLDYLNALTDLLQRIKVEDADAGVYEAADVQWWWREDDAPNPKNRIFYCDGSGEAFACLTRYPVTGVVLYDLFYLPSMGDVVYETIWPAVFEGIERSKHLPAMTVREDDHRLREMLVAHGFGLEANPLIQTQLEREVEVLPLPAGFEIRNRAGAGDSPHHMIRTCGEGIGEKLRECSLYQPGLDLFVCDEAGRVSSYALFWADSVTKIGLIEPVRTNEAYQRKGLARCLITAGVELLKAQGMERVRVCYNENNSAARELYHGLGFEDQFRKLQYVKEVN